MKIMGGSGGLKMLKGVKYVVTEEDLTLQYTYDVL